jgi:preprotein translocase subunit YajC
MSIFLLFFQDPNGGSSGLFGMLPLIAIIFAIFYFLVIRPQQKQQKELQQMITALKINDEVVTNGGIIGKIKEVRETSFIIVSAEKTFLEVGKSAVIGKKAEEVKS